MRRSAWVWILLISAVALAGCQADQPRVKPLTLTPQMKKILVVSFRNMNPDGGSGDIRCSITGKVFGGGAVAADAPEFLTQQLRNMLDKKVETKFISPDQAGALHGRTSTRDPGAEIRLLTEIGQNVNSDGVLTGHVYRFQDRVGRAYSAESPASVAFDLHLIRVADGRVMWTGVFDETQKSLSEDLFQLQTFLDRDGQWVTAYEMASEALEHVIGELKTP